MASSSVANGRGAGWAVHLAPGLVSGDDLAHRLFALAAHDDVELAEERRRLAGRQRTPGDQQPAAPAQTRREPQTVAGQRGHGVDAHDLRPRRQGPGEGLVSA